MDKKACDNCGAEFRPVHEKALFCLPCELVIQSVEPPEILKDMRHVYRNQPAHSEGQKRMRALFEQDGFKFTERLTKLEDQYRSACSKWEQVRRLEAAPKRWDGKGDCPACGRGEGAAVVKETGTVALIGRVEGWLKKQPEGEE